MKLLTYRTSTGLRTGIVTDKGVVPVPHSVEEIVSGGQAILAELNRLAKSEMEDKWLKEEELTLGPCLPKPGKMICVGLNYRKHADETGSPIPETPILFNKFPNTLAADRDEILIPHNSKQVDYEAELAIVIGKTAKRVSEEEALDYVFGYCTANDVSARDLQFRTNQWLLGKCCDGFSPIGPYLVTADEVGDPDNLGIRTYVNGELRQNSNTSDMIFSCREIVSYISQHMTLSPGDIIFTGTPEGVILGYPKEKQVWLKDGDEVVIEIDKLGRLTNYMKQEI
ncbi:MULTISPECIES: fumarylacetoacetate hydrolase family protein [Thermoactinomyces]|jgi:2-keto-4-pentenoate hydratase/2-oxohepta-3-ene-1,7-dioic acid hydratase in catechol pathway|uniref:Fumarylacetoacetate hydrolase family protein n=1 Tax=Thermoactinomyces daqus TaxID=1329516 RepID=A0A7W1X7K6_9BACL|nr:MULTISPECIES: fumarylacetoacetate hydrolase family protein [Thermoactinomyces]MBA4541474.1 fumarylacetoacetate hydrolase family protein [Thermoactinomyces daqus]MBH8607638.1 fumarylacetoacetate hydrolase family protein [Thermoactinomyces sp. CICC 10521]